MTQTIFLKPLNGYKTLQTHFWGKGRKNLITFELLCIYATCFFLNSDGRH